MKRTTLALIAPLALLLAGPTSPQTIQAAQNGPRAEPARPSPKAVDARIDALEKEVAELERLVAEQGRRIAALEERLAPTQVAPAEETVPQSAEHASPEPPPPRDADVPLWTVAANWQKLHTGMSEAEVVKLLGPPSATREIGFSRTLVYRGDVPGSGAARGEVKLKDGKVSEVDPPDLTRPRERGPGSGRR